MKWNAARPVPWKRLFIEWAVIGVVVGIGALLFTKNTTASSYLSILFGGVVYVGFGALLAKLGYQRKTLKQMRAEAAAAPPRQVGRTAAPAARPKPAPTSRTSTGPGKSSQKKRR
jgi:hypothetical protein